MQDQSSAILEALIELKVCQAKMLANQENFLKQFEQHVTDDRELAQRITSIETKLSYAAGAVALIVAFFSVISNYIMRRLV